MFTEKSLFLSKEVIPSLCPTGILGLWGLGSMAEWMYFRPTQKFVQ